jgi:hypothetical protein
MQYWCQDYDQYVGKLVMNSMIPQMEFHSLRPVTWFETSAASLCHRTEAITRVLFDYTPIPPRRAITWLTTPWFIPGGTCGLVVILKATNGVSIDITPPRNFRIRDSACTTL